jgi:5-methylcytosine-specific restriction protein B
MTENNFEKFISQAKNNKNLIDWVNCVMTLMRENFPKSDHYITRKLVNGKWVYKVVIGIKEPGSKRGVQYFQLILNSKSAHLYAVGNKFNKYYGKQNLAIRTLYNTDKRDVKDWILDMKQDFSSESKSIDGEGRRPNDYSSVSDEGDEESESDGAQNNISSDNFSLFESSLNQILYGPPGTGKTYETIFAALKILDPEAAEAYRVVSENNGSTIQQKLDAREKLKICFDEFSDGQRIRFVTFHQSFSYEDFIEGLRAETKNGQVHYEVVPGVFLELCNKAKGDSDSPYVLIIDEINRGNISKIFGELITLIEPSKRIGAGERLTVTLPYSKTTFGVPDNIYIIGTMNTSDRSLAGMDVALRRRFTFIEMPPKYDELIRIDDIEGVNVGELLKVINERIEVLLGRDYCIGHAYFMGLQKNASFNALTEIFRNKILPLLQEYFFEDWQRIRWVLNDHRKDKHTEYQFITEHELAADALFGANVIDNPRKLYRVQDSAFTSALSYIGILDASKLKITSASSDEVAQ